MQEKIKGTIEYEITCKDNNIEIEYNSTIDNDLAVMIAAQYVMEGCAIAQRAHKANATGRAKKDIGESLNRILAARNGLNITINMFLENYDTGKKIEFLKENNITIEKGRISKEEGDKILGIIPKDTEPYNHMNTTSEELTSSDESNDN